MFHRKICGNIIDVTNKAKAKEEMVKEGHVLV